MYNNWSKKCRFLGTFDKKNSGRYGLYSVKSKMRVLSCEKKIGGNV